MLELMYETTKNTNINIISKEIIESNVKKLISNTRDSFPKIIDINNSKVVLKIPENIILKYY